MQNSNSSAGIGLGIAGLVLGILSLLFCMLPCMFGPAVFLGIIGMVLSAVGLSQAKSAKAQSGIIIAGLVLSLLGTSLAFLKFSGIFSNLLKYEKNEKNLIDKIEKAQENAENSSNEFEKAFQEAFKNGQDSVSKKELDEKIEKVGDDIKQQLKEIPDEEKAKRLGRAAGVALKEFSEELQKDSIK